MNYFRNLTGRMSLRNRRLREKYCLLVIFTSFFLVCIGMVFFLPDLRARTTAGVQDVYQKIPDLFLSPHVPIPPPARLDSQKNDVNSGYGVPKPLESPRNAEDRRRLFAKIEEEEHRRVLEKPKIFEIDKKTLSSSISPSSKKPDHLLPPMGGILSPGDAPLQVNVHDAGARADVSSLNVNASVTSSKVIISGGEDPISEVREKRNFIKLGNVSWAEVIGTVDENTPLIRGNGTRGGDADAEVRKQRDFITQMMKDAWDNYRRYAWGENELKPITGRGHSSSIFGASKIGATIVDAVDTLYIMGLESEYQEGRKWIAEHLDFDSLRIEVSVFETNIRFVGGLLSMYALTGDSMYRDKAYTLGKKLLPAFDTPTGIPYALITLNGGKDGSKNYGWASSGSSILSEFGTLHLEFTYLSDITGDPIFREKVYTIRKVIKEAEKTKGLYFNYFHPRMGKFTQSHVSMGALGDSFYEYLLKSYIQTGDIDAREMYDEAMDAFEKNGLIRYSKSGLVYFAEMKYDRIESKMDHLACFSGGLLALGAHTDKNKDARTQRHLKIAQGITNTCHESYIRTHTRLGPESFRFSDAMEARALRQNEKYYILRPEVIESYFVLWRLTGDSKYRDWGWDAAQAIQKHCKSGVSGGYSGLRNVYSTQPQQDDVQQSFFLAETLKYLYLLFSSNELIDLSEWVFNTEAHPLPVKATNPLYRPAS